MRINEVLNGKYLIKELIGEGSTSRVYLAEDFHLGTKWAIKCINKNLESVSEEISALSKINHRAFPKIIDVIHKSKASYIVQSYVEGLTLKETLKSEEIRLNEVLVWIMQLAEALNYLQKLPIPIRHRDIKPDNIIIDEFKYINIIDFGIASIQLERPKVISAGSYNYSPPEQMVQTVRESESSDIYSFGAVTTEIINRYKTQEYAGKSNTDTRVTAMEQVCVKCSELLPESRYNNFDDIIKAILSNLHKCH